MKYEGDPKSIQKNMFRDVSTPPQPLPHMFALQVVRRLRVTGVVRKKARAVANLVWEKFYQNSWLILFILGHNCLICLHSLSYFCLCFIHLLSSIFMCFLLHVLVFLGISTGHLRGAARRLQENPRLQNV